MASKRSRKTSNALSCSHAKVVDATSRGNKAGQFKKEVNVGRSLAADRQKGQDKSG